MGYRDETIALRERLEVLEPKVAKLSGEIAGLSRRSALAAAMTKELQRSIDIRHSINLAKYRLGIAIALFLVCVGSIAIAYGFYRSSRISETYSAREVILKDDTGEHTFSSGAIDIEEGLHTCVATFTFGRVAKKKSAVGECEQRYGLTFRGKSKEGAFILSTNVRLGGAAVFRSADHATTVSFVGLSSNDAELFER